MFSDGGETFLGEISLTDGMGVGRGERKYGGAFSNRVLETQVGPEGKQLQIMHLHGNKTVGPAHVIIPYKYRRRGRAKLTCYHLN